MSFATFSKRNLAFFKLAMLSNLEYRLNFFVDAIVQPSLSCVVEIVLWSSIFASSGLTTIGGFTKDYYIAYALWATFIARISSSWMYELRMTQEIESGTINGLLVRPMSFYEYYLSQLMGYKFITTVISLLIPVAVYFFYKFPFHWERLPTAMFVIFYYLILVHSLSFLISCFSFFLNRVHGLTVAKNFCLWLLSGELFPLDIVPEPYKSIMIQLPFSSAVYIPTGYLTGRIGFDAVVNGLISITVGIFVVNFIGYFFWRKGLKAYVGTGA